MAEAHQHGSVAAGPPELGAVARRAGQHAGVGKSGAAATGGGDHVDRRADGREKGRGRRGGAAVVGQLQDVGSQIRSGRQQRGFARGLEVAGNQHASTACVHAHDERALVAGSRPAFPRRPQRDDAQIPHAPRGIPAPFLADRHARGARGAPQRVEGGIPEPRWRQPQRVHPERVQHGHRAAAVVQIRMGDDEEIETAHAQGAQRRHHAPAAQIGTSGKRRPGVDQHRGVSTLNERGVPLPDVQGGVSKWVALQPFDSVGLTRLANYEQRVLARCDSNRIAPAI